MASAESHSKHETTLRQRAEDWLSGRAASPTVPAWQPKVEALAQLYSLANNAATSPEALKLLHELQVHQVEFTLRHEELQKANLEIAARAREAGERHDFAPIGYLTVDGDQLIVDLNAHAARLLASEVHMLVGRPLSVSLDSKGRRDVLALLRGLPLIASSASRPLRVSTSGPRPRELQLIAKASPPGKRVFVAVIDSAEWVGHVSQALSSSHPGGA